MSWAFATLGHSDKKFFFHALASAAERKINEFCGQSLASTAWAFAKLGQSDQKLFAALARVAEWKTNALNALGMANMAWAFATLNSTTRSCLGRWRRQQRPG